jgi:uncharacterized membrane protein
MSDWRRTPPLVVAGASARSGIVHFVRPRSFEAIMPRILPRRSHLTLTYGNGVPVLVCAWGLRRGTRWASAASTAVLAAVFPAIVQMALDAGSGRHPGAMDRAGVAWGRLPLQLLLIWADWQARPGAVGVG